MGSISTTEHHALRPAMPGVKLALEHVKSDDYFQQLLSIDSALQALEMSRQTLQLKLETMDEQDLGYEASKQSIDEWKGLVQRLEKLHTAARSAFNLRARSLRKDKVGIMDLPNELLLRIFDNLKWRLEDPNFSFDRGDHGDYQEDIQNIRLTCRRFHDNSSHLLVRQLGISLSMSSLKRLKEVTRHPKVWQRVLKIDLSYYNATIARDLESFAAMCGEELGKKSKSLKTLADHAEEGGSTGLSREGEKNVKDGIEKAQRILSSWEPLTDETPIEERASLETAALAIQRGHQRYLELFQQQQEILRDGYFARAVAEAAARSGSEVWLSMSDNEPRSHHKIVLCVDQKFEDGDLDFDLFADPDVLAQSSLIQPQAWWRGEEDEAEAGEIPQSLLYELPLAMRTARARLAGIAVNINPPPEFDLSMSQDQLSGLSDIAEGLLAFTFRMTQDISHEPQLGERKGLNAYLRASIGRQAVPNLWLSIPPVMYFDFVEIGRVSELRYPVRHLLHSPTWHRLESLRLEHLQVDLQDLSKLMGMLKRKARFYFNGILLRQGTWAAALDCLRSKADRGSRLLEPEGPDRNRMTHFEYCEIFKEFYGGRENMATQYITSVEGVKNPCPVGGYTEEQG